MTVKNILKGLVVLGALNAVSAHSWVEQVRKIDSTGAFTGPVGYPIGFKNRTADFSDLDVQNKILDTKPNPAVCKPKANAYASLNRLTASAGDSVALIYQENGHVTQPFLTPRPYRDGLVSVYGTLQHEDSDGINDVLNSWTADGKGGNGKGQLLATHYYDDGQCYQNAGKDFAIKVYADRYKEFGLDELFCQTDFKLPDNLPETGTYTVMWVWDWPLIVSDTMNTTEIYTSCAEIQLGPKTDQSTQAIKFNKNNPINSAAISSQLETQFEATGLGIGTNPPASATGMPSEDPTTPDTPSASSASASVSEPKKGHGGIKTVTVTADAATTTHWVTVTVPAGNAQQTGASSVVSTSAQASSTQASSAQASSSVQASSSAQASSTASAQPAAPVANLPVTTISKFMRARATGQARRDNVDQ
ncbi:hypothetical protein F4819DRAFT_486583 [Hypoxylon fuscum]|nr:hypothetical protein F4819DRAFT_486583 [Hypoxylon fuscum]